ncbi:hypothetical protein A0H81_09407 [Grifola frondosa]|uniref:Uncharacterized protein n=1 Tax=Grifola frondosa TaxID=5627 RepID=A0A1C7M2H0_GRIFR|nr:hypothetical protein A0H81_09407 [Grifola frondosa]
MPEFTNSINPSIHVDEGRSSESNSRSSSSIFLSGLSGRDLVWKKFDLGILLSSLDEHKSTFEHELGYERGLLTKPANIVSNNTTKERASEVRLLVYHSVRSSRHSTPDLLDIKTPAWAEASLNLQAQLVAPPTADLNPFATLVPTYHGGRRLNTPYLADHAPRAKSLHIQRSLSYLPAPLDSARPSGRYNDGGQALRIAVWHTDVAAFSGELPAVYANRVWLSDVVPHRTVLGAFGTNTPRSGTFGAEAVGD